MMLVASQTGVGRCRLVDEGRFFDNGQKAPIRAAPFVHTAWPPLVQHSTTHAITAYILYKPRNGNDHDSNDNASSSNNTTATTTTTILIILIILMMIIIMTAV